MNSRKTDWTTIITAFQVGFCGNAALWRMSQHKTEDIFFPVLIATLSLVGLVIHTATKREEHNNGSEPRSLEKPTTPRA